MSSKRKGIESINMTKKMTKKEKKIEKKIVKMSIKQAYDKGVLE